MAPQPQWPCGKVSVLSIGDPGLTPCFPGQAVTLTSKLVLWLLPCQIPGVTGSVIRLAGWCQNSVIG